MSEACDAFRPPGWEEGLNVGDQKGRNWVTYDKKSALT